MSEGSANDDAPPGPAPTGPAEATLPPALHDGATAKAEVPTEELRTLSIVATSTSSVASRGPAGGKMKFGGVASDGSHPSKADGSGGAAPFGSRGGGKFKFTPRHHKPDELGGDVAITTATAGFSGRGGGFKFGNTPPEGSGLSNSAAASGTAGKKPGFKFGGGTPLPISSPDTSTPSGSAGISADAVRAGPQRSKRGLKPKSGSNKPRAAPRKNVQKDGFQYHGAGILKGSYRPQFGEKTLAKLGDAGTSGEPDPQPAPAAAGDDLARDIALRGLSFTLNSSRRVPSPRKADRPWEEMLQEALEAPRTPRHAQPSKDEPTADGSESRKRAGPSKHELRADEQADAQSTKKMQKNSKSADAIRWYSFLYRGKSLVLGSAHSTIYHQDSAHYATRREIDTWTSVELPRETVMIDCNFFFKSKRLEAITLERGFREHSACTLYLLLRLLQVRLPPASLVFIKAVADVVDECGEIGAQAFMQCSNLRTVTLPPRIDAICRLAFFECTKLTHITLPDFLTTIQAAAFQGCASLERIHLPKRLEFIGAHAFESCVRLKAIAIPPAVTSIPTSAFRWCLLLQDVHITTPLKAIGDLAFQSCEIRSLTVTTPLTVGHDAFTGCSSLTTVDLVGPDISLAPDNDGPFDKFDRLKTVRVSITTAANSPGEYASLVAKYPHVDFQLVNSECIPQNAADST